MSDFYNNLKRELSEMSSENIMITVLEGEMWIHPIHNRIYDTTKF